MTKLGVVVLVMAVLSIASCGSPHVSESCGFTLWPKRVELDELIRHPRNFDGKVVRVSGFYSGYGPRSEIFLESEKSPFDADAGDGVDLDKIYRDLHGKIIVVTGRFSRPVDRAPFYAGRLCVIYVDVADQVAASDGSSPLGRNSKRVLENQWQSEVFKNRGQSAVSN